ncbi:hypothetical protein BDK51DRAFT_53268 [Blyttiomyces helicus]|uniref:Mon2/Sec7/BIG1-like dimerisation and cyclophilin-binding domain-containing protein n=1 Tax=Blyttiomyces helicus TaxID=388810 RepID=A0A4P9WCY5_9FUNG|nr:hypothetical protein BDK51DRAFT_53268 [Blyttiomyces helicus]|eukprot:RKO89545.1 hypothetical protein BDK51DRAFT_53268 [Blyttiomyces helicus]
MSGSGLAGFLQNELLTLSSEARRKHPEIKEVCGFVVKGARRARRRGRDARVGMGGGGRRTAAGDQDAAERLLYIIRALKERPAPAGGVDIVATELAKTDDVLRPFIMSCDTKNQKLVPIAVGCLQKLISHHAIPEVLRGRFVRGLGVGYIESGVALGSHSNLSHRNHPRTPVLDTAGICYAGLAHPVRIGREQYGAAAKGPADRASAFDELRESSWGGFG